jgi:hypothetical protein
MTNTSPVASISTSEDTALTFDPRANDIDPDSAIAVHYPDVANAHINPLTHFLQHGLNEGRSPFGDGVWG